MHAVTVRISRHGLPIIHGELSVAEPLPEGMTMTDVVSLLARMSSDANGRYQYQVYLKCHEVQPEEKGKKEKPAKKKAVKKEQVAKKTASKKPGKKKGKEQKTLQI